MRQNSILKIRNKRAWGIFITLPETTKIQIVTKVISCIFRISLGWDGCGSRSPPPFDLFFALRRSIVDSGKTTTTPYNWSEVKLLSMSKAGIPGRWEWLGKKETTCPTF